MALDVPVSALQNNFKRRTIRMEVNPLDKSTVVSIYPREIHEFKWTIQPGEFKIAPGTYAQPSVLVVGSSSWWRDVDPDQPLLEIPTSSVQVADSVVKDYCNGLVGCDMADNMPGLFFLPGEVPLQKIKTEYKALLDKAKAKQDNWYRTLVKIGDLYWARTNGNPISIMDIMRLAAKELGEDRPWMQSYKAAQMVKCFACGNLRNPDYPVCSVCRAIDTAHPEAAKIKFAV